MTDENRPTTSAGPDQDPMLAAEYRRLGTGGPVPPDVTERVTRGVSTRRRRTRVAGGLAAAAVVVGAAGVAYAVLPGSGDGGTVASDSGAASPSAPQSTLQLQLPDGSTVTFDDLTVTCDPADLPEGAEPAGPGERIFVLPEPYPLISDGDDGAQGGGLSAPLLYLEVRLDQVQDGRELRLPIDDGDSSTYPVILFAAVESGESRPNELSSAELDSRGTATVLRAECGPDPVLELDVDAVLGSEVGQQPLALTGSLR